jgi:hypothetical protein
MAVFKSKLVYLIFFIRLIFFLALITSLILLLCIGVPGLWKKYTPVQAAGLAILGIALFMYLLYSFGKSIWMQRFAIIIEDGTVRLKDIILQKSILLDDSFKGYSYSSYGDGRAAYNFKTLLFYFNDGQIIEFPEFLFSNFKYISEALINAKVNFLGNEPYRWKNLISRVYHFK